MKWFGCKSTGERLGFVKGSLDPFSSFLFLHVVYGEIKSKLSNMSVFKMCFLFFKRFFFSNHLSSLYVNNGRMFMNVDVNVS